MRKYHFFVGCLCIGLTALLTACRSEVESEVFTRFMLFENNEPLAVIKTGKIDLNMVIEKKALEVTTVVPEDKVNQKPSYRPPSLRIDGVEEEEALVYFLEDTTRLSWHHPQNKISMDGLDLSRLESEAQQSGEESVYLSCKVLKGDLIREEYDGSILTVSFYGSCQHLEDLKTIIEVRFKPEEAKFAKTVNYQYRVGLYQVIESEEGYVSEQSFLSTVLMDSSSKTIDPNAWFDAQAKVTREY